MVDATTPPSSRDGRVEVEIRGQSAEMIARQLAGFAGSIEVLWPDGVRRQLAEIGRALVRHHGEPSSPGDG
jgi:predicted DNA-binding transcriptional regulator YafY